MIGGTDDENTCRERVISIQRSAKRLCSRREREEHRTGGSEPVRVAFDTRPSADAHGLGRYARCMVRALHETAASGDEIVETQHPSAFARSHGADVFHAPWMSGALLHSPCPMVVTVHGLAPLKRRSEHLRGGLRMRLRHLAVQRAARVIVPTRAVAH